MKQRLLNGTLEGGDGREVTYRCAECGSDKVWEKGYKNLNTGEWDSSEVWDCTECNDDCEIIEGNDVRPPPRVHEPRLGVNLDDLLLRIGELGQIAPLQINEILMPLVPRVQEWHIPDPPEFRIIFHPEPLDGNALA